MGTFMNLQKTLLQADSSGAFQPAAWLGEHPTQLAELIDALIG
jgi:hypothetical protein